MIEWPLSQPYNRWENTFNQNQVHVIVLLLGRKDCEIMNQDMFYCYQIKYNMLKPCLNNWSQELRNDVVLLKHGLNLDMETDIRIGFI